MGKLDRRLRQLTPKERKAIAGVVERIVRRDLKGLDVKRLKGLRSIFRVRKGDIRVIFEYRGSQPHILVIERRSEKTYRF